MISNGLITKWHKDYWPEKMVCNRKREQVATLQDTQSVFFILGIALLLACVILILERICKDISLNTDKYVSLLSHLGLFSKIQGHKVRMKYTIKPAIESDTNHAKVT